MTAAHPLQVRVAAAQAALGRYDGVPFAWGKADCARLAAFTLKALGYRVSLAKGGAYTTALGAHKALRRAGHERLEDALDEILVRIPPAAALPADIVALQSEDAHWPALCVALGNGRVLGFHEGFGRVLHPLKFVAAWRASPCRK